MEPAFTIIGFLSVPPKASLDSTKAPIKACLIAFESLVLIQIHYISFRFYLKGICLNRFVDQKSRFNKFNSLWEIG